MTYFIAALEMKFNPVVWHTTTAIGHFSRSDKNYALKSVKGKTVTASDASRRQYCITSLYSNINATFTDDTLFFQKSLRVRQYRYIAYEIDQAQFYQFQNFCQQIESKKNLQPAQLQMYHQYKHTRNCRDTTKALMKSIAINTKEISSSCLRHLPCEAKTVFIDYDDREATIPTLFIRPLPIDIQIKKHNPQIYKMLKLLRDNIVRLSQTNYGVESAHQKVEALRELYNLIHREKDTQEEKTINEIIHHWKADEKNNCVHKIRPRSNWWCLFHSSKSTSTKTLEKLEKMASNLPIKTTLAL